MELSNREWVGRALEILARGLVPFVDRHMARVWLGGEDWLAVMVNRARREGRWTRLSRDDARLLLRVIEENQRAYLGSLSKLDLARVREFREIANCWAHFEPFSQADASRALETAVLLLRATGAAREAAEVGELLSAQPSTASLRSVSPAPVLGGASLGSGPALPARPSPTVAEAAGTSRADRPLAAPEQPGWRADGPVDGVPEVRVWAKRYIPFERLGPAEQGVRAEIRRRAKMLRASAGQIMEACYAGPKPPNADVENLVLYNIDSGGAWLQEGARYGLRFEMADYEEADGPPGDFPCFYRYRLISSGSELTNWRSSRVLARFEGADLGGFPATKRMEQAWLAIHRAAAEVADQRPRHGAPFATFLRLSCPRDQDGALNPELVKALMDASAAAFQGHDDKASLGETAARIAAATGQQPGAIAGMLANDERAVLGTPLKLAYLRGTGVQWNRAITLAWPDRSPSTRQTAMGGLCPARSTSFGGFASLEGLVC